ncbi:MAG TPA: cytochrome c family protein [bacterium]|nr:cytochrome c family protein [bacterium]
MAKIAELIINFIKSHSYFIRTALLLLILVVLISGMLFLYYIYPHIGIGVKQPISFSHRVHAGDKDINCRFCHHLVDKSMKPGIPSLTKCFYCHDLVITSHPQILKLKEYKKTNTPVPWIRVYDVPDYVYFSHKRHIAKEIDCTECHGNIKTMDRITYKKFEMGFCVNCHRERNASLDCVTCHK